jgi:hypothetical protein
VRKASAGTVPIRDWRGTSHRVTVLDEGVVYREQRHRSLSKVRPAHHRLPLVGASVLRLGLFLRTVDVPGIGSQDDSAAQVEAFWDIQNDHATFFTDSAENRPFYVNEQAPKEYLDLTRYTEPSGLNLIMR